MTTPEDEVLARDVVEEVWQELHGRPLPENMPLDAQRILVGVALRGIEVGRGAAA